MKFNNVKYLTLFNIVKFNNVKSLQKTKRIEFNIVQFNNVK